MKLSVKQNASVKASTSDLNCFIGKSFPCGGACFSLDARCQRMLQESQKQKSKKLKDRLLVNKSSTPKSISLTAGSTGSPIPVSQPVKTITRSNEPVKSVLKSPSVAMEQF